MKIPSGLFVGVMLFAAVSAATADIYAPKPPVPEGCRIVQGDILEREFHTEGAVRNDPARYWPGGVVPFVFDDNVSEVNRTRMRLAMDMWQAAGQITFIPRTTHSDYVHIQNSTVNSSFVGRAGGPQIINIASWDHLHIVTHELAHCLGFWHPHNRPDRNSFIRINLDNVQAGAASAFRIDDDTFAYGPYDFDSVMHYQQCAFSVDCAQGNECDCIHTTIDALPPNQQWQARMGQRLHLSQMDRLTMSLLYPPPDWRFVDRSFTGSPNLGILVRPYRNLADGQRNVPNNGTLALQPGNYAAVGTHAKPMTLVAPLGGVNLTN